MQIGGGFFLFCVLDIAPDIWDRLQNLQDKKGKSNNNDGDKNPVRLAWFRVVHLNEHGCDNQDGVDTLANELYKPVREPDCLPILRT